MDNVSKARQRLAPLGNVAVRGEDTEETDRRITKVKQEFDILSKHYQNEIKAKENKKKGED